MLESSGFDYRNRYPQKYLVKFARHCQLDGDVVRTAYKMMLDLYRTFAPIKQASATMAVACLELTARLSDKQLDRLRGEKAPDYRKWRTNRTPVMETMLDLLDLYTHHPRATIIGPAYSIDKFISVRITLNQEADERKIPRYSEFVAAKANGVNAHNTPKTPITPSSPSDARMPVNGNGTTAVSPATLSPRSAGSRGRGAGARGQDGTVRFMLDAARAKQEQKTVKEYFEPEWEEYEVEVEEPVVKNTANERSASDRYTREREGRSDRYERDPKRRR